MPNNLYKFSSRTFFLFLTAVAGLLILSPFINFCPRFAQGDHGLSLYAAQAVSQGQLPYHDFHWYYGPGMPYYYALFLNLFGQTIPSVLLGQILLKLISGILVYVALSFYIAPVTAFCAALWFWGQVPDFFYTFNHTGGLTLSLATLTLVFAFLKNRRPGYLYAGFFFIFLCGLVKINIGLSLLFSFVLSIFLIDLIEQPLTPKHRKIFYVSAFIIVPLSIFAANGAFLYKLPFYLMRQCLPYFGDDRATWHYSGLGENIKTFFLVKKAEFKFIKPLLVLYTSSIFSLLFILFAFIRKKINAKDRKEILFLTGILTLFFLSQLHEFLISGVIARSIWAKPFGLLLIFAIIGFSGQRMPSLLGRLLVSGLLITATTTMLSAAQKINAFKTPAHFINHPRAGTYTTNAPEWTQTVTATAHYLDTHLSPDELFFAVPYEPLYFFLAGKLSPTRQIALFDFLHIAPTQEKNILADLEEKHVRWVILSNRSRSEFGVLGETYCPLIGRYIKGQFQQRAQFGDFDKKAGFIKNHSVRILKRENIF